VLLFHGEVAHTMKLNTARSRAPTMTTAVATDETQIPLGEQLEEIGAQLDWVRGYL